TLIDQVDYILNHYDPFWLLIKGDSEAVEWIIHFNGLNREFVAGPLYKLSSDLDLHLHGTCQRGHFKCQ
ncbi:hypothetical protein Ciccas_013914, partial [Cichlidogyrus casuarinus]